MPIIGKYKEKRLCLDHPPSRICKTQPEVTVRVRINALLKFCCLEARHLYYICIIDRVGVTDSAEEPVLSGEKCGARTHSLLRAQFGGQTASSRPGVIV